MDQNIHPSELGQITIISHIVQYQTEVLCAICCPLSLNVFGLWLAIQKTRWLLPASCLIVCVSKNHPCNKTEINQCSKTFKLRGQHIAYRTPVWYSSTRHVHVQDIHKNCPAWLAFLCNLHVTCMHQVKESACNYLSQTGSSFSILHVWASIM